MNAITSILKQLPGLKSSADFDAAITDLETEHASAISAVSELEAGREAAIFNGGNLDKLASDISAAEREAEMLNIALAGARRRRDEAAEAERMAGLKAVGKRYVKMNGELRSEMIGYAKAAETLAGHAGKMKSLRDQLRGMKAELVAGGCGDLAPRDPIYSKVVSNIEEVKARAGRIIAVVSDDARARRRDGRGCRDAARHSGRGDFSRRDQAGYRP